MPEAPMTYDEIVALLERRFAELVPTTFRVHHLEDRRGWVFEKVKPAPDEWYNQEYAVWVSTDAEWIVATYGNNDIGMGTPFQLSLTMSTASLRIPGGASERFDALRQFVAKLLECPPNEWGYT